MGMGLTVTITERAPHRREIISPAWLCGHKREIFYYAFSCLGYTGLQVQYVYKQTVLSVFRVSKVVLEQRQACLQHRRDRLNIESAEKKGGQATANARETSCLNQNNTATPQREM